MNLYLINAGMTLSILCFYIGYYFRRSNNTLHKRINLLGILFNLATAVFLLIHKYLINGIEAAGIFPSVPITIVNIHRAFAFLSLILMLLMGYTGITKNAKLHKKIHFIFLPLYTIVFISGLFIFETRN
ncbi:MAG TPA: DUF420 domain-containing protein [Leptospiraceae bacterium]|nr:DUF420 domain-containing protein [Leptospiraceae bacterium]HMW06364.1 DUF420 domain-containing protein [Leptospiraceae bacterium]HMX30957.1 DUF420 domain-containing protein [Leptospiraceae bacterium]HMY34317.1 DUF420 domain-containing protein [Leptospiraceae bacterium]HMZ63775.1 DUF420 domain-containing protein [Leptospiraceae bacterium]